MLSPDAAVLGIPDLPRWVVFMLFPQALKHEAEGVNTRSSPLVTLSSFSLSVLLHNEPLEFGNTSWAVYGSAIISRNVHLFILTGAISFEGVYCWFLFPSVLAVTSLLCYVVRMSGFYGLDFWIHHF